MNRSPSQRSGFTLIELLAVVGVIAIVAAMLFPVVGKMRRRANMSREISAARQLMAAYLLYPADNDGDLLPGYGNFPAVDDRGEKLSNPINYRYPWRIAPYLRYNMRILWGNNEDDRLSKLAQGPRESYIYGVSVQPALGVNAAYVGGDYQVLPPTNVKAVERYGRFCVTQLGQAAEPGRLIVFASAGSDHQGQRLSGYFKVEAPHFTTRKWAKSYSPTASPSSYGQVDFRYDDKAVAAMLDGHVELLDFEQMNDMRRWSNQAALADNSTWTLGDSEEHSSSSSGSSSGGLNPVGSHIDGKPTNSTP